MTAPFQSIGIVFFVTIVHVVVIVVYSSRPLPQATFKQSIASLRSEALEAMPVQLVGEAFSAKPPAATKPPAVTEPPAATEPPLETVGSVETAIDIPTIEEKTLDLVKQEAPEPEPAVVDEEVKTEAEQEKIAQSWEGSAFAERVSFSALDESIGKKPKKLADNKSSQPHPSMDRKNTMSERAPRVRAFSPIPKS